MIDLQALAILQVNRNEQLVITLCPAMTLLLQPLCNISRFDSQASHSKVTLHAHDIVIGYCCGGMAKDALPDTAATKLFSGINPACFLRSN